MYNGTFRTENAVQLAAMGGGEVGARAA